LEEVTTVQIEPIDMDMDEVAERWAGWNARSAVSHAGHFAPARNDHVAFHRLSKPLSELRVALATSGGVYVKTQPPFDMVSRAGDDSVRWIPSDVDSGDLRFAHDHYDHTDADQDPNCMFPLDRLRELAADKVIGSVAAGHVGFMGFVPDPTRFMNERIPQVASRLKQDHVDAVVLSPG
jgi:D-proline reductase (dithiol) PrdB